MQSFSRIQQSLVPKLFPAWPSPHYPVSDFPCCAFPEPGALEQRWVGGHDYVWLHLFREPTSLAYPQGITNLPQFPERIFQWNGRCSFFPPYSGPLIQEKATVPPSFLLFLFAV